jgi:hypothetical protein
MGYIVEQGSYGGHELTRPLSVGATEPTTFGGKAKGWLYMLGLVGIALVAIKLTGKKKRKNPRGPRTVRAQSRKTRLAKDRWFTRVQNLAKKRHQLPSGVFRRRMAEIDELYRQEAKRAKGKMPKSMKAARRSILAAKQHGPRISRDYMKRYPIRAAKRSAAAKKGWRTRMTKRRKK